MATTNKIEDALVAYAAQLTSDRSPAVVVRRASRVEPEELAAPSSWPSATAELIGVFDVAGGPTAFPEARNAKTEQYHDVDVEVWLLATSGESTAWHLARREHIELVEALTASAPFQEVGYRFRVMGWARIDSKGNARPYVGVRLRVRVIAWE